MAEARTRAALLLAQDGQRDGRAIVPRVYLLEATDATRRPPAFGPRRATPFFGYGYQFWLYGGVARAVGRVLEGVKTDPAQCCDKGLAAMALVAVVVKQGLDHVRNLCRTE